MGPNLTVCIPAYRSEAFIHNTLRSLLTQTYSDFIVQIAVEPPAEETLSVCAPFLRDDRVSIIVNPQVLGWAENIKSLLRRVTTPYFMILPNDDVLQSDYIATLLSELIKRPQASVAYSDIVCFGRASYRLRLDLTEEPIFDRLMSFFLGGMEGDPFRGVTRTSVSGHVDFPTDRYAGFAVECEWVLHLLISGAAVHVPRPLYLKRTFGPERISASAQRLLGRSREQLFEALEDHRARMLALIRRADLPKTMRDTVELAAEAAMLRRHMTFNIGLFSPVQLERSEQIMTTAGAMPGKYGKRIQAKCLLAMSQHSLIENDRDAALNLAMAAVDADPLQWEGLAHLGWLQLDTNRCIEAFDTAQRAWTLAPHALGLRELIAECASNIERTFMEIIPSEQELADRFDAAGYLIDHPDVAAAAIDPLQHYREFGWREGRKIRLLSVEGNTLSGRELAERFDAVGYLIDHPDVAAAGLDPLQHYREFGWREKRKIRLMRDDELMQIRHRLESQIAEHSRIRQELEGQIAEHSKICHEQERQIATLEARLAVSNATLNDVSMQLTILRRSRLLKIGQLLRRLTGQAIRY